MKIDQKIIDMIRDKNTQVPTLPVIVEKILTMAREDSSSAKDLAAFISRDQAISNKILRLSNSAYYGMMKEIDSIPRAITIIGFNEVVSLTIGMSVLSTLGAKDPDGLNMTDLWIHSLACAFASRKAAKKLGVVQADQAFLNGLLHDMGKVILAVYFPDEYRSAIDYAKENDLDLYKGEKHILGVDHATLSGLLMERWNFPNNLLVPAQYHHAVDKCPPKYLQLTLTVTLADYISQKAGFGESWIIKLPGISKLKGQLGMDKSDIDEMAEDLKNNRDEIETFFEVMQ